jgi:ankyrin repeat protein
MIFFDDVDHHIFTIAEKGDLNEMELILSQNPALINMKTIDGAFTPLMFSIGNDDMARFLVSRGADVNAQDVTGLTALMWAIMFNSYAITELLISNGADVNARDISGDTPLIFAAKSGKKELVELLITSGSDLNAKCKGNNATLNLVIAANADLKIRNTDGWTALMFAEAMGHIDIVELLRKQGAIDVFIDVRSPLTEAIINGDFHKVKSLIYGGHNVNDKNMLGYSPLYLAVKKSCKDIIELLISAGANLNDQSGPYNRTALLCAISQPNKELAQYLILKGADVNVGDRNGVTAIICAAEREGSDLNHIINILISYGADVNVRDCMGTTSLMHAARNGNKNLVELLISNGVDINAMCKSDNPYIESYISGRNVIESGYVDGWTALMFAEMTNHADIAALLGPS